MQEKYLKYKKKYLLLKQTAGAYPEDCDCVLDEGVVKKSYLECDESFQNLNNTCWAISSLMILLFGDSTKKCTQTVLMTKTSKNILTGSLDLLYIFAPFLFDDHKKIYCDIEDNIIKLIDYLREKITKKIESTVKPTKENYCELKFVQTFNKIFFKNNETIEESGPYSFMLINLISCLLLNKLINFNEFKLHDDIQKLESSIGILINEPKHVTSFYKCNGVYKYCNNDIIVNHKWIDFFKRANSYKNITDFRYYDDDYNNGGPFIYQKSPYQLFFYSEKPKLVGKNQEIYRNIIHKFIYLQINEEDNKQFIDNNFNYYLTYAAKNNLYDFMENLLSQEKNKGKDLNYVITSTALAFACSIHDNANYNIAELLLNHGANPNSKGQGGETPLFMACVAENIKIIKLLINYGADPDLIGAKKHTPLGISCLEGNLESVKVLLENCANPKIKSDEKELISIEPKKNKNKSEIIELLTKYLI
jgi:hypothetical protein